VIHSLLLSLRHMCAQILEQNNFFSDEAKFHITEHISQHNCVIWGSEPLREHLEHEQDSLKVNGSCTLTYERVIGLFLFDDDIITSKFLYMFENYALLQLNKSNQ
jgi:hypothetical protein